MISDNGNPYLEQLGFIDIEPMELTPFFPATAAWAVLLAALFLLLLFAIIRAYSNYRHKQYRRDAVAAIDEITQGRRDIEQLPVILKAVAMQSFSRQEIAALNANEWLVFLQQSSNGHLFKSVELQQLLLMVSYQPRENWQNNKHLTALHKQSKDWIKQHKIKQYKGQR
jgi:hypothetical protein